MRPSTTPHGNYANLRVSHLFDSVHNTWNCALLNTVFNTQDVADICKIPLHSRPAQDSIIWTTSPNGNYSVKTAYRLCLNLVLHDSSLRVNGVVFNVKLFALFAMAHLKMNCTSLQIALTLSRVGRRLASDLIWDFNWCRNMLNTDHTLAHVLTLKKPSKNWLKCNVDGAIFTTEGKFGISICFRDSLGSFVQAHTMIIPFVVIIAECEATAMKHALALALSNGFERVIFESDRQQVVNDLCNDYLYANALGTLLQLVVPFSIPMLITT
ncbi:replication protein A 70 kDa DNA-binding subunit [Trifolium pratense]|uniref:Replication protein A 70 kDa DNA-binding subunit n=1 Tax=Trifolium pratense TaxID=57577 RepID=A0A2K3NBH9_TRIPR|nr:replication protein A 70 kDa DNA-binding subunit [Trifolium pratense]